LNYIRERDAGVAGQRAGTSGRTDEVWNTLSDRAKQGLNVDRNDPNVRQASDAYAANEERAKRNSLSDMAESQGPNANLRSETRLANERVGQRTGAFEAEMVNRELGERRNEIAQALSTMSGMANNAEARGMQEQLALLDSAIRQQGTGIAQQSVDQDAWRAQMQNSQFGQGLAQQGDQFSRGLALDERQLSQQGDQFTRGLDQDWRRALMSDEQFNKQLGFNAEDRASYYDLIRRGLL